MTGSVGRKWNHHFMMKTMREGEKKWKEKETLIFHALGKILNIRNKEPEL